MKKLLNKQGHIAIVEKAKETSSDTGMDNRAITHEQMCLECRDPFQRLCTFIYTIYIEPFLVWDSLSLADC